MITNRPPAWDKVVDVIVMGSGAAGLTAATLAHDGGAEVLVLEKSQQFGGTTGVSGGMPWIPLNRHLADVGVSDSREEALTYLRRLTLGTEPDPDLVETFVDTAAEMLDYLESKTPLRMTAPPASRTTTQISPVASRPDVHLNPCHSTRARSSVNGLRGCAPARTCRG